MKRIITVFAALALCACSVSAADLATNQVTWLNQTIPGANVGTLLDALLNGGVTASIALGAGYYIVFEGATDDAHETTVYVVDPTGDRTILFPDTSGTVICSTASPDAANAISGAANAFVFEGSAVDAHETTLQATNPTADVVYALPDAGAGTYSLMSSTLATNAPDIADSVTGGTNSLIFEGTLDAHEIAITPADATADVIYQLADAAAGTYGVVSSTLATNAPDIVNSVTGGTNQIIWEGTANTEETVLQATDPTADVVYVLPDAAAASYALMMSTLTTNAPEAANSVTGGTNSIIMEGATANDFETAVGPVDATADRTILYPDSTGALMISALTTNAIDSANSVTGASNAVLWEGTANDFETSLVATDPTADNTVTIPDDTGYLAVFENANTQDVNIVFEGATSDDFETTLTMTDATADRTFTFGDESGTVLTDGSNPTLSQSWNFGKNVTLGDAITDTVTLTATLSSADTALNGATTAAIRVKGVGLYSDIVSLGAGTNGTTETTLYTDDTPAGEWTAVDADVVVSADATIYRYATGSLKMAFADTAANTDGAVGTIGGADDLEADASVGFWVYSTATLASGDIQMVLTDDGGARTYDFVVASADAWSWIEIDISALAGGTGDAVTAASFLMTAQGEAALGAFDLYIDGMYKWAVADEETLGANICYDGVSGGAIWGSTSAGWTTPTVLVEQTDYFTHYEDGADYVVWISDQSARSNMARIYTK